MKNKIIILITILISLPFMVVRADMGAPQIIEYSAYVSNTSGADYYNTDLQVEGHLQYQEKMTITFETNVDGKLYGMFILGRNDYYILLTDIANEKDSYSPTSDELNKSDKVDGIVLNDDVNLYKGPSYSYAKGVNIPKNTIMTVYYFSNVEDQMWFYVSYNNTFGWVNIENAAVAFKKNVGIMFIADTLVYKNYNNVKAFRLGSADVDSRTSGIIKQGTVLASYYETDEATRELYVSFGGITGFVGYYGDVAYAQIFNIKVTSATTMYSEPFTDSTKVGTLSSSTKVASTFSYTPYKTASNWYYVTYNNVSGWISDECDDGGCKFEAEYVSPNADINVTPEETTTTTTQATTIVTNDSTTNDSITISTKELIYLCIGAGIIISLTAIVTLVLVNKRKKNKTESI
jgi:hypothetical protein